MDIGEALKNLLVELERGINVKVEELKKSQETLERTILEVDDEIENMKTSVEVSEEKYSLINEKLNRVPALKKRAEGMGKRLLDMHNEINEIKKWLALNKPRD